MQCLRDEVGVNLSTSASEFGSDAVDAEANSRRSTDVSMKNFAPRSAASRRNVMTPPCFSPLVHPNPQNPHECS